MEKPIAYEIWLVQDSWVDDLLIATFESKSNALKFFNTIQDYEYPSRFNRAVLEKVEYEPDGSGTCIDVLAEMEF